MKRIKLNNGVEIPQQGFGTYLIPKDKLSETIGKAYEMGYRQFDTAWRYGNEKEIAKALKENGIRREDVFITSKFNITGSYKSLYFHNKLYSFKFRSIKSVFEQSLEDLDTDYIDLYLMHFPYPMYKTIWEVMSSFYVEGRFKAIGVCSFLPPHIEAIKSFSDIVPAVNQFEISPLNSQKALIQYCQNNGITVEAMSTFSHYRNVEPRKEILENELLLSLAKKYGKSVVQVVLRWIYQQNIILIPKTWDYAHMLENISITDFELSDEDMKRIDSLNQGKFLNYNPYKSKQGFEEFWANWSGFKSL